MHFDLQISEPKLQCSRSVVGTSMSFGHAICYVWHYLKVEAQ